MDLGEEGLDVICRFNKVAAEPRKVFHNDALDGSVFSIRHQPLKFWPVKICAGIAVIDIDLF